MVRICIVKGCRSESYINCGISFHGFPKNEDLKKKWIDVIPGIVTKYSMICGLHFQENDFESHSSSLKKSLKPDAIPSIFPKAMEDGKKLYKCDMCIRTYSIKEALERHRVHMHGKKLKVVKRKPLRNRPPARTTEKKDNGEQTDTSVNSRTFLCPICAKTFPSEFVAQKHIDVYHSKAKLSKTNTPKQLVECRKCKQKIKNLQPHICQEVKPNKKTTYHCSACNRNFYCLKIFDNHIVRDHKDMVENLYFPSIREFTNWKESTEKATCVTYTEVDECDSKKIYRCRMYTNCEEENRIDICPSMILIEMFPKGVLTNFYTRHFDHSCTEYKLTSAYKKYCITNLLKASNSPPNMNGDPYLHLKTIMENIAEAATKINVDALKQLVGKALEMTLIVNTFDEEKDVTKPSQFLSDAEISQVLQNNSTTIKRVRIAPKITEEPQSKKPRESLEEMAPKIVNTFSLAGEVFINSDTDSGDENDIDEEILKSNSTPVIKTKEVSIAVRRIDDMKEKEFASFNDTYKDFVSKNFVDPNQSKTTQLTKSERKPYAYRVNNKLYPNGPIKDTNATTIADSEANDDITLPDSTKPIKNTTDKKSAMIKVRKDILKTPKTGSTQLRNKSETKVSNKEPLQENIKSNIIKPSQEKPKTEKSERVEEKSEILRRSNRNTPSPLDVKSVSPKTLEKQKKIDYEYEVIEQETGCNILVLKV